MANTIVTKFVVGTLQGINTIEAIGTTTAREKYANKVSADKLESFIKSNLNHSILNEEMNSLSNQFLVVYFNDAPAGYARITSEGQRPEIFGMKTAVRIADFSILKKFDTVEIREKLFEKCLAACNMQQVIWISDFDGSPDRTLFESYGFKKNMAITGSSGLGLAPVYLVKEKEALLFQNK